MVFLEKLKPVALLFLRLGLAAIFIFHGYPKLFGHAGQWLDAFGHMGFPRYFAYIAGALEFFGGLLLIVGLFTRIAGLLLAIEMAIAIWRVHLPQGPILDVHNYELPLALFVGSFTLAAVGAGLISMDHLLYGRGGGGTSRRAGKDKR
jgi:putative oxidoreductase